MPRSSRSGTLSPESLAPSTQHPVRSPQHDARSSQHPAYLSQLYVLHTRFWVPCTMSSYDARILNAPAGRRDMPGESWS